MVELFAEAAHSQDIGRRGRQEDALVTHFCQNDTPGLAVLSDGMGGHDDGDLAARILAGKMFSELFLASARRQLYEKQSGTLFEAALNSANRKLHSLVEAGHLGAQTGGTLVSILIDGGVLRWLSVGDSPLYLFRQGALRRLNEDHSMAPQLDLMVARGEIDAETAQNHGDRNCLTSAVTGRPIPRVDCPAMALTLQEDDILILASDGINTLADKDISEIVHRNRHKDGQTILTALMTAVRARNRPDQDNTSVIVVTMRSPAAQPASVFMRMGQDLSHRLAAGGERFLESGLPQIRVGTRRSEG